MEGSIKPGQFLSNEGKFHPSLFQFQPLDFLYDRFCRVDPSRQRDKDGRGLGLSIVTLVVPTICIYEVFKRLLAQRGEEAALQAVGIMSLGFVADLTRDIAVNAAAISSELKIAMADSIILATTRACAATCGRKMRISRALVMCSTLGRSNQLRVPSVATNVQHDTAFQ
jgi:hypothetical protein